MATISERKYFAKLADFGCILCAKLGHEGTPAEIHHLRNAGIRANAPVIPLCPEHHRGNTGIHGLGKKAFERMYALTEQDLLKLTHSIIGIPNG
jgi:hypothetical protein